MVVDIKRIMLTLCFVSCFSFAQQRQVRGVVKDDQDIPLLGVDVIVKGTNIGVQTDFSGEYTLSVNVGDVIIFTFIGMRKEERVVGDQTVIDVVMAEESQQLGEVVVTALGIKREKRALGYAVQRISAEQASTVKSSSNFVNGLSGKVSGIQVKRNTNMGGSTNVVIRGSSSLSGNNQALFVVDGVPIINRNTNSSDQRKGRGSYDFGNTINDINPEDIASVEVLKGAAASVLYGSQAANGVVMITTKKGEGAKGKGVSISLNSNTTVGFLDRSTFPKYQKQYGAGYSAGYSGTGKYWHLADIDGDGIDDEYVVTSEDASYGAPFDGHDTYHWWSLYPELDTYRQKGPWKAADNGPDTFFETPITLSNTVTLSGAGDKGTYRISYTNYNHSDALPNGSLQKNNISFGATYKFNDRLSSVTSVNYTYQNIIGLNRTGYDDNIMTGFRQWWQTNVDIKKLKEAYEKTGKNISWNPNSVDDIKKGKPPIFWDNPYFNRYKNYASLKRGRWLGNFSLNYDLYKSDKFNADVIFRVAADTYGEIQEERLLKGSVPRDDIDSYYKRRDLRSRLYNYDGIVNFSVDITDDISLTGLIGGTIRRNYFDEISSETNGGLKFPGVFSLSNSVNPISPPEETAEITGRNSVYSSLSFDYNSTVYLEAAVRGDHNSTLPENSSTYFYPSISSSFVFTELIPNNSVLSFGKLRLNYAEVGNATDFARLKDFYSNVVGTRGASATISDTKKNYQLVPERQKSKEIGLDIRFFDNKIGLDMTAYQTNTENQIVDTPVSESTGYSYKVLNGGEIRNRGLEISLKANDIKLGPVKWSSVINWTKNVNKVLSLSEGINTYQLGSLGGGITINAVKGQPFGVIYGTDYMYSGDKRVLEEDEEKPGQYKGTGKSNHIIGNQNPLWFAGFSNSFSYKRFSLDFLIDTRYGGDIFSLDMYYGLNTGLYEETAFINDLGNPVRNTIENGGGFINPGVNPDDSPNTIRIPADHTGAQGYGRLPVNKAFVYDGSYVKLRELKLGYDIPVNKLFDGVLKSAKVSVIGSNLWILYKNLPYADPEASLGSGNLQGYSVGSMPLFRQVAFDLTIKF